MFEWLSKNKEWFLSGAGLVLMSWLGSLIATVWRGKTDKATPAPAVVNRIYVHGTSVEVGPGDRATPINAWDIVNAIKAVPPLQQTSLAENYAGIRVDWTTSLADASLMGEDVKLLLFASSDKLDSAYIWCTVKLAEHRELAVLAKGAPIRVQGVIERVDYSAISLTNARLTITDISG